MTEARSIGARVGIAALNLIAPGLGLLRLAKVHGLVWMVAPATAIFCAAIFFATTPTLGIAPLAIITA